MFGYLKKALGLDGKIIAFILPSSAKMDEYRRARKEQLKAYREMALAASDDELLQWVEEREQALRRLEATIRTLRAEEREE